MTAPAVLARSGRGPRPDRAQGFRAALAARKLLGLAVSEDVAAGFGMTRAAASRLIRSGALGPYSRVGRRLVLRIESLRAALAAREVKPEQPVVQHSVPLAPTWAKALLESHRRRAGR